MERDVFMSATEAQAHELVDLNVEHDLKVNTSGGLGFSHVDNLGKYLGVPLLHQRVTKETFQYIVDNMRKKLAGWKSKLLSLADRITLAKGVLATIPIYAMQSTKIPKGVCHEMEKIICNFGWGKTEEKKGLNLVKWDYLCKEMKNGGLGFKKFDCLNNAFLMKIGFNLVKKTDHLWVQVLRVKYRWKGKLPISLYEGNTSCLWKGVCGFWSMVRDGVIWNIGNGASVDFWRDNWIKDWGPLINSCTKPKCIPKQHVPLKDFVSPSGDWNWPILNSVLPRPTILSISAYKPPSVHDRVDSARWIWHILVPQKLRVFIWLGLLDRILTNENRVRRQLTTDASCMICESSLENIDHVLRFCTPVVAIWIYVIKVEMR
ncbi:hypothetical protein Golax_009555 [Gossypium laxum]|uniref:Reverse transcriptase zinc-binding domain-containing protein n=1 Tax=Gossypium laxum TaxID=34288 RepID=A0A7J9ADC7_9ROSI|nr:hypothetical protein [Gossypium laxum]